MSKLSQEEVDRMLAALREHFNEPVMPASHYCNAFYAWEKAIKTALREGDFPEYEVENWTEVVKALNTLLIPIRKSNFLWRLIYGDGVYRTEKCPEHKGRWSGYFLSEPCKYGCCHGYDITGWLPEVHEYVDPPPNREPEFDENGKVTRMGVIYVQDRCYQCGGTLEDGKHDR